MMRLKLGRRVIRGINASLSGAAINGVVPGGIAEYRIDSDGRRKLEITTSSINLAAGTLLNVTVNGAAVGQMTVNGFGGASLNLETNNGQNVPFINNGDSIRVNQNGNVVLTGIFGHCDGNAFTLRLAHSQPYRFTDRQSNRFTFTE